MGLITSAYNDLKNKISSLINQKKDFEFMSNEIVNYINCISRDDYLDCVKEIGIIPEDVKHDSTEEKFYAKVSDSILSRGFSELGLKSRVLVERGDAADVVANSFYHNYSLVGDAKIFRLSRTAKNQKDFKVAGLDSWRGSNNYAVLCSPLYQYPSKKSQVYKEALEKNVLLFSWESLYFLLVNNIKESYSLNLSEIWNYSFIRSGETKVLDEKNNFLSYQMDYMNSKLYGYTKKEMSHILSEQYISIEKRASSEKKYWQCEIDRISNYSKEQAINDLLVEKKIDKKIKQIDKVVKLVESRFE